jgi:hypothetical protein
MTCTPACRRPSPTQAHCGSGCHRTFGSVSGFDAHRRGGRCVDPASLPMHLDPGGIWRRDGRDPHADARSARAAEPQGCEIGSGVGRDTPGEVASQ